MSHRRPRLIDGNTLVAPPVLLTSTGNDEHLRLILASALLLSTIHKKKTEIFNISGSISMSRDNHKPH